MEQLRNILAIPFGYVLAFFFTLTGNYLLSLLLLTVVFKIVMLPPAIKQQKGMAKQVRMQAKTKKIQEMYKGNNQKIQEETQALYSREGFNPMSAGCLPMLIQLPVMLGLYGVIYNPLTHVLRYSKETIAMFTSKLTELGVEAATKGFASEIPILNNFEKLVAAMPDLPSNMINEIQSFISKFTLWGMDLTATPTFKEFNTLWLIPILSGVTAMMTSVFMYFKQKQTNQNQGNNIATGCMTLMSPAMSIYFAFLFPAGVGLYWIMNNILAFIQTVVLSYTHNPKKVVAQLMIDETVQRRSRENSIKNTKEYLNNQ